MHRLETRGRWIVRAGTDQRVVLRGVNLSGLEYSYADESGFLAASGITEREIGTICNEWGARVVRLPLNQDWALRGRGRWSAEQYCAAIDQVVSWSNVFGAYALLDLQWLDADRERGAGNRVPPLPDADSPAFWRKLAARYRDAHGVLFDVFNEPHDPMPDDPYPALTLDGRPAPRVTWAEWRPWAEALVDAVRAEKPDALCFVSGADWGYDLRGAPIDRDNIVYSTHVYRARGDEWEQCFGAAARVLPVFAGEWGGSAQDLGWGTRLAEYLDELEIGWTAWSWRDRPHLQRAGVVTGFGQLVRDRLA